VKGLSPGSSATVPVLLLIVGPDSLLR